MTQPGALTAPTAQLLLQVDWRNRKGRNNVTPVEDQGGCGSCVAFGLTATLESMVLVEHNVPLDLSEAELLFCGGGSLAPPGRFQLLARIPRFPGPILLFSLLGKFQQIVPNCFHLGG